MKKHTYIKFYDDTGKPVKNLWQRNGRLYAQISINGKGGRFPLEAQTATSAILEVAKIKESLRDGQRAFPGQVSKPAVDTISFAELNKEYFASHGYDWDKGEKGMRDAYVPNGSKKSYATIKNERGHMRVLLKFFPGLVAAKIDEDTMKAIKAKSDEYKNPRRKNKDPKIRGVCGATTDNRNITLGNVLEFGVRQRFLSKLPVPRPKKSEQFTEGPKVKYLLSKDLVERIMEAAGAPPKPPRSQLLFDPLLCDGPANQLGYKVLTPEVPVTGLVNTDTLADRYGVSDVTIRNLKNRGVFPFSMAVQNGGAGVAFYEAALKARPMFVDYLKFLRFSGARESEASMSRWENMEFETGFVIFPSRIQKRGHGWLHGLKHLKMNPDLRQLLDEMRAKRDPNCPWLFPSLDPMKAADAMDPAGLPQTRWDTQWERVNKICNLRQLTGQRIDAHHLRHRFITCCLMAGIPAVTVAKWVGNSLKMIYQVYGHIIEDYEQRHAGILGNLL